MKCSLGQNVAVDDLDAVCQGQQIDKKCIYSLLHMKHASRYEMNRINARKE